MALEEDRHSIFRHILVIGDYSNFTIPIALDMNDSAIDPCERLQRALCECHRRAPTGPGRDIACRHLNHALAQCLVSEACPEESEAVRSLCASAGTSLKRTQCQRAQLALSICISSHQQQAS